MIELDHFNYWHFVDINPILRDKLEEGTLDLIDYAKQEDYKGDTVVQPVDLQTFRHRWNTELPRQEVLEDFAASTPFFLEEKWMRRALSSNYIEFPTTENRKELLGIFFTRRKGKRTSSWTINKIRNDQLIFVETLVMKEEAGIPLTDEFASANRKPVEKRICEKFDLKPTKFWEIWSNYQKLFKAQQVLVRDEMDNAITEFIGNKFPESPEWKDGPTAKIIQEKIRSGVQLAGEISKRLKHEYTEMLSGPPGLMPLSVFEIPGREYDAGFHSKLRYDRRHEMAQKLGSLTSSNEECSQLYYLGELNLEWNSATSFYYPFGFCVEGFVRFLRDCRPLVWELKAARQRESVPPKSNWPFFLHGHRALEWGCPKSS